MFKIYSVYKTKPSPRQKLAKVRLTFFAISIAILVGAEIVANNAYNTAERSHYSLVYAFFALNCPCDHPHLSYFYLKFALD